jgi:predicted nuclease of restriction endonuclease-like RecB superfamily
VRDDKREASSRGLTIGRASTTDRVRPFAPAYFTFADAPWLQALLDERSRFTGQRRSLWRARAQHPLPVRAPLAKLRVALDMLDRLAKDRCVQPVAPRTVRAALFRAAADFEKGAAIAVVARQLGLTPESVTEMLFADLPDERVLMPLPAAVNDTQFALLCNELMIARCLQLALRVRVFVDGNVRAVVRHVKWTGLLCVVRGSPDNDMAALEVSGPYALFRHTRLYGRALASLLPRLARCNAYRLEADCLLHGGRELGRLTVRSGDPISPARELPRYDSRVEERFAIEFSRLAREWEVVREPRPIVTGTSLFFPDFQLRRRSTGECYWLEIVGYWTHDYLAKKLAQLEHAQLQRLILCVDEARCCSREQMEALGQVVWYKRRVDVLRVIAIVDPALRFALGERRGGDRSATRTK